jgi:hypothetical protein
MTGSIIPEPHLIIESDRLDGEQLKTKPQDSRSHPTAATGDDYTLSLLRLPEELGPEDIAQLSLNVVFRTEDGILASIRTIHCTKEALEWERERVGYVTGR